MVRGGKSIAAALIIVLGMLASFTIGLKAGHTDQAAYVIDGTAVPAQLEQPFYDLWQGYLHLNSDSYWRPFSDQKQIIYHAVEGMLAASSTQDLHTTFVEPTVNSAVTTSLQQELYGIGATVTATTTGLLINPLVGSPASLAKLMPGDTITHVDGKSIAGMQSAKAVALIRGRQGTIVALTIVRSGVARPFVVKVTRGTIPNVADAIVGNTGIIAFQEFDVDTANEVHLALKQLEAVHITSLILDLRGNGGGYVDTARNIASEFLPKNAVIYWERSNDGRTNKVDTATRVTTPGLAQHLPVVVLVDGNTASAAEILATALSENGHAKVIGTTTYGKGSVQEDIGLPDGSALRITIRLWLTPKKHWVQNTGITPDIQVAAGTTAGGQDAQMARALTYLSTGH